MKLLKLTVSNFMPYKGSQTIEFPTEETRNIMLVLGENMRGKTSLMNALRWGFYDKALGRHSRRIALQDIVNKDAAAEGDWRVDVHIVLEADGHRYELRRTADRRPQVLTPSRPEDFIVSLHLTRDGIVLSGDQYESEINQIAPEQVSRFFLFDGELLDQYEELLVEGSEQGRQIKEAIEQVLGVPALINGRNQLGAILKAAQKSQAHDLAQFAGLRAQGEKTEKLTTLLDTFEADLVDLSAKLVGTRQERTKLEDELEGAASVIALNASLDAARESEKTQAEIGRRKREERKAVLSEAWKDLLTAKLSAKRDSLASRQADLMAALKARSRLEGQIDNLKKVLATSECPTCHQTLSPERRDRLGGDLGALEVEWTQTGDALLEMQGIAAQIDVLDKIRGVNARERLTSIDRDIRTADVAAQKAENDIERITDQIAGHDTAELARKRVLASEKLKEEGRLTEATKAAKERIQQTKDDLAIAQRAIEGLAGARTQRSTQKAKIAADLEKTFQHSIEKLRDRLRKRVEHLASEAFKHLTTQKAYRGLEINDSYGLSILDSKGRKVSIRSAGAEHIVALSLIDGLNRTGRAIGPILMDTPFGRLDPKHRDNILTYLPTVASQFVLLFHGGEVRIESDLASVNHRVGAVYEIVEVSDTQSKIVRRN